VPHALRGRLKAPRRTPAAFEHLTERARIDPLHEVLIEAGGRRGTPISFAALARERDQCDACEPRVATHAARDLIAVDPW
jgi:hypothetical protein